MSANLVSVIMCTYNGSKFIVEQLDSICAQTYPNLEIIIVDDASTDATYEILTDYARKDKRIRLSRNEQNLGFNKNFNNACWLASGEFIALSDQDDIWHTEKIARILKNWTHSVPLMYCDSVRFYEGQDPLSVKANPRYRRFNGTDSRKLAVYNTISGHAIIMKRSFLPLISPFPANLMYDWWAGVMAACNGGAGYLPETLVFQRVHEGNATVGPKASDAEKKHNRGFKKMVREHLSVFATIKSLPEDQRLFFRQLFSLWSAAMEQKFSWSLFIFLLKNSRIIFNAKKKAINIFSYAKHSYRLASN